LDAVPITVTIGTIKTRIKNCQENEQRNSFMTEMEAAENVLRPLIAAAVLAQQATKDQLEADAVKIREENAVIASAKATMAPPAATAPPPAPAPPAGAPPAADAEAAAPQLNVPAAAVVAPVPSAPGLIAGASPAVAPASTEAPVASTVPSETPTGAAPTPQEAVSPAPAAPVTAATTATAAAAAAAASAPVASAPQPQALKKIVAFKFKWDKALEDAWVAVANLEVDQIKLAMEKAVSKASRSKKR